VQIVGWIKKLIKDPERFSKVFTGSGKGSGEGSGEDP